MPRAAQLPTVVLFGLICFYDRGTMPPPPLRVAILECDTPLDNTKAKYGGYGGVFASILRHGADLLQRSDLSSTTGLQLTSWDIHNGEMYPRLQDIDAILVTGSRMFPGSFCLPDQFLA